MYLRSYQALALLLIICSPVLLGSSLAAAEIDTVAGAGGSTNNGSAGLASMININQPFGVEVGPDGGLYITEVGHHRVFRLDLKTRQLTTVAGSGKKGYAGDGGPATQAELNEPYEVRFDAQGNMYFVEMMNHVIRRVDLTGTISTIAGDGQLGFAGDGGPARQARFSRPHSIVLDGKGGLYVADIGNHRIRRIDLATGIVTTIAGNGERSLPVAGELAAGKPVSGPRALYLRDNTLWVALREGHSIWSLDLNSGRWTHVAGTGERGFAGDGKQATLAQFDGPKGIALGPQGDVFVVDTENQVIRRIDPKRNFIETIAGRGPAFRGFAGDKGPATAAQMDRAHGICVGPDGTVYIGDTNNHRVRAIR